MSNLIPAAVFLDVDGVLIDSVDVKGDVFVEVFADFPNSAEQVLAFHRAHGGLTREIKIRQILELLGDESPSEPDVSDRVSQFTRLVVERVVQAPEIPGTHTFLQEWSNRCPFYAVSATPDEELQRIMIARGLMPFFRKVSGWPPEKSGLISKEIASGGFEASRCLLVGDSDEDYQAAKRASVRFIFFGVPTTGDQQACVPRITSWSAFGEAASKVLDYSAS
ncbi:HAD family phosphatase [bacterium]|nr:HAD family phosphatase [bacterium]